MSRFRASTQADATGTPSASTFLRGDDTWATPAGGGAYHGCKLTKSAAQSTTNNVTVALTWDTEAWDTDALHSTSSNTSRITVPTGLDGFWLFTAGVNFAQNGTGLRAAILRQNGSAVNHFIYGLVPPSTDEIIASGSIIAKAVATDYFEVWATQSSGGALNVQGGSVGASWFSCTYLGS